jgi:hypothetical protein
VQAQDYAHAKWALGRRTRGALETHVERELDEGAILRTHVLRPTWHFVAPEDIRWLLALTGPRIDARNALRYRQLGLDAATFRKSRGILERALARGRHRTPRELRDRFERAGIDCGDSRFAYLLMRAELDGLACSGVRRGRQNTWALLEERVPPAPAIERDDALSRLAVRYFSTRGPATARDFAWWSGLSMADARRAVDVAGDALEAATIGDAPAWMAPDGGPPPEAAPSVQLLPVFDEYYIGLRDRDTVTGRLDAAGVEAFRTAALTASLAFVDGQLVGRWRRSSGMERVVVRLEPLTRIRAAELRRARAEAGHYARFLGRPLEFHG